MRHVFVPVQVNHETNKIVKDPKTGFAKRNAYNEGGEIIAKLSGRENFAGYWNNPEATEKKYITDVFEKGDLYYRSGDALRRTEDGRWFFMDRLGDTYRWNSENVSTAEVAEHIGRFPGILEANVYGVQVPGHEGRAGCAALTIAPEMEESFDRKGFAKATRKQMPPYAVPVLLRALDGEVGISASHNNKQNKVKLRTEGVSSQLKGSKVAGGERDEVFWTPPKVKEYVAFGNQDWQSLVNGAVRL